MKKKLFSIALILLSSNALRAQLISPFPSRIDGISIGLEKSRSFFLEYAKGGFDCRLKQSLTFDRARYQHLRIEGGYTLNLYYLDITCDLFYSSNWYFNKYNLGSQVFLCSRFFDKYGNISVRYVPYYDNELKFKQGGSVSGKLNLTKEISLVAEYGNTPDFRIAYKRLYIGAICKIKNLSVYPLLEVPFYENEVHLSHSHIVVSMSYALDEWLKN